VVVEMSARVLFLSARFLLLTLLSYFCALSVNSLVAMWLTLPPSTLQREGALTSPPVQQKLPLSAYAIIHTKDIFNAVKAPVPKEGPAVVAHNGTFKLWGTAIRDRDDAFAIIEDQSSRAQGLYRKGQTIAPGVTLVQVDWDRVIIEREGRPETLVLPTDAPAPPPTQVAKAALTLPSDAATGVSQVAPDTFQLDRQEVDRAMSNLNEIFTQVRAVPYSTPDGVTQGFRLFSIKAESLIDRLGLKNGDIVQRVNGIEVSDPSTAFTLLQDLQGYSQVRVDVLRNHQPVTLSYEIR
jgi:general secretion pathway protein C